MKLLCSYLRRQVKLILMLLLFVILFAVVFSLYNLPVEAVVYASALCLVVGLLLFAVGYGRYVQRHRLLQRLLQNVEETAFQLPPPMEQAGRGLSSPVGCSLLRPHPDHCGT